jgi:class 3 adenylate cyclase
MDARTSAHPHWQLGKEYTSPVMSTTRPTSPESGQDASTRVSLRPLKHVGPRHEVCGAGRLNQYHPLSPVFFQRHARTYAGDGVMVVFNYPGAGRKPGATGRLDGARMRYAIGALTETWRRWGHEIGFGIGISHGFATLGTIGFEGRFDYAAIGTVSNVASRLCDEAKRVKS